MLHNYNEKLLMVLQEVPIGTQSDFLQQKTSHGPLRGTYVGTQSDFFDSWLFYPLADCPPHGLSSMDEPPYELSTVMFIHQNGTSTIFRMV